MNRIDTSPSAPADLHRPARFSVRNRVGFVIALLLSVGDVQSVFQPTPDGQVGPPFIVLVVGALCGVATLAGVGYGWWRRNRAAIRVAAGGRVLSMLLSLPVFFVSGLPSWLRVLAAVGVVLTVLAVVLMLTPARRTAVVER